MQGGGDVMAHTLLAVGAGGTWKATESPDSLGIPYPASLRWQQTRRRHGSCAKHISGDECFCVCVSVCAWGSGIVHVTLPICRG